MARSVKTTTMKSNVKIRSHWNENCMAIGDNDGGSENAPPASTGS